MAVYVFHHIPKCGGSASLRAFKKWYRVVTDYRVDWSEEATGRFVHDKHDLSTFGEEDMLIGHFELENAHLHQRYPEVFSNVRFEVVTFVREPLELAQSLYFYERENWHPYPYHSLSQRLDSLENYMATIFPCTEANYKAVLDRYAFIGLTEHLQVSFDILAHKMGKPRLVVPVVNTSLRDETLTAEEEQRFKDRNQLDYKIYDYCCRCFEAFRTAYDEGRA